MIHILKGVPAIVNLGLIIPAPVWLMFLGAGLTLPALDTELYWLQHVFAEEGAWSLLWLSLRYGSMAIYITYLYRILYSESIFS